MLRDNNNKRKCREQRRVSWEIVLDHLTLAIVLNKTNKKVLILHDKNNITMNNFTRIEHRHGQES